MLCVLLLSHFTDEKNQAGEVAELPRGWTAGQWQNVYEDTEVWRLLTGLQPSASGRATLHSRDIGLRMCPCLAMWPKESFQNTALFMNPPRLPAEF